MTQRLSAADDDEAARPAERPLRQLGRWLLRSRAGVGSLATVYRARPVDAATDRWDYAVKLLHRYWEDSPTALAVLRREALAGRVVSSPHLASVLAAHLDEPPYYLVQPWLEGQTVAARLADGWRPGAAEVVWLARQAAQGLAALDAAGWTHGDVKPANLMLSQSGHVTLLDLGFARPGVESGSALDRPVLGTPRYLAPELVTCVWRADIRSDLYSLGATLYELFAGRPPYDANDLGELVRQHRQERPLALELLAPGTPPLLAALIQRLLAKDPLRRPSGPAEIVAELVRMEIAELAGAA